MPDSRTPNFLSSEFQFEVEPSILATAILKINIVVLKDRNLQVKANMFKSCSVRMIHD